MSNLQILLPLIEVRDFVTKRNLWDTGELFSLFLDEFDKWEGNTDLGAFYDIEVLDMLLVQAKERLI